MTNEEKARAYQAFIESKNPSAEAYDFFQAYLSGCQWKDQQFKEYLEKKKTEMLDKRRKGEGGVDTYYKRRMVEEIINELFKED